MIYGAGDLCLEVVWYIEQINKVSPTFEIIGILDDFCEKGTIIGGYPILGGKEYFETHKKEVSLVFAISVPSISRTIIQQLEQYDFISYPNIISPYSIIATNVKLGKGIIVPPGVIINTDAVISDFVKFGQGASINHHCVIGAHTFVAPSATVTGHVTIGEECFIGAVSAILPDLFVGNGVTVGAGAVVTKNIEDNVVVVGIPAVKKGVSNV